MDSPGKGEWTVDVFFEITLKSFKTHFTNTTIRAARVLRQLVFCLAAETEALLQ